MGLHDLKLLRRQAAGLVEDLAGDGDLADIVEGGGVADEDDVVAGQAIAVGLVQQVVQQHLGQDAHVAHMETALAVAELHDVAEDLDHHGVLLFFFIDLVGQQTHQFFLFPVEQDGIGHAAVDHQRVKGAADKVGTAQAVGPLHVGGGGLCGDHNDRHVIDPVVLVHDLQDLESVHVRHDDVQQQEVDLRLILSQDLHGPAAVLGLYDLVLIAEHIGQNGTVHFRVVRDQYFLLSYTFAVYRSHTPFKVRNQRIKPQVIHASL